MKVLYNNKDRVLNKIEQKDKVLRFLTVDYPVLLEPFNITEKYYDDDFHIIEYYMDRLVCETVIKDKEELLSILGLTTNKYASEVFYNDLILSGHILETKDGLMPTELAKTSVKMGKKITIRPTKRKLYFDAINLMPLPTVFYKNSFRIRKAESAKQLGYSYLLSTWENPNQFMLKERIIKMTGEDRLLYNIPQELIDIEFDYEQFEDIEDNIQFTPFYLAVFNDGSIKTYDIISEQEEEFFLQILTNNPSIKNELFTAMGLAGSSRNKPDDLKVSILHTQIPLSNPNLKVLNNDCFVFKLTRDYIDELMNQAMENKRTRVLRTIYSNELLCSGDDFLGSIVYLDIDEKNLDIIEQFLIDYEKEATADLDQDILDIKIKQLKSKRRNLL